MEINQQTLLQYMADPASLSEEDMEALEGLVRAYPYFQLSHTLLAKAKHDRQTPDAYASLNHAAIYASSRRKLRQLFYDELRIKRASTHNSVYTSENPQEPAPAEDAMPESTRVESPQEAAPAPPPSETPSEPVAQTDQTQEEATAPGERLYQDLEENLQRLRTNRAKEAEHDAPEEKEADTQKPGDEPSALTIMQIGGEDQPGGKQDADDTHYLLDYLRDHQATPQESLDDSQQRQLDLIDKFMTAERDVKTRWKAQETPPGEDLSERNAMDDDFVTENLADIYTRQGRRGKAVEIYQKLILKYPEKRTYFAEKIESLKKE